MNIKSYIRIIAKHPLGALYGALLGFVAFFAAVPMCISGMYDAAIVDLAMAAILIALMLKNSVASAQRDHIKAEKIAAYALLIVADILALLPTHSFAGSITSAIAFSLLISAFVLYFSGTSMALASIAPALWCCVFMPYHEELMLLLSFPLRLSATVLSAGVLNIFGWNIIYSGTTMTLPGLNIAITDACSGINQLDAFILIAFIAVQILHRKTTWKILHFAFIVPSVILGNALRIILTMLLYRVWGERVFENSWHTALGYSQIIFALLIFLAIGTVFTAADKKPKEVKQ